MPTYECFNRCTYCNFRVEPGKGSWLSLPIAATKLQQLRSQGVCEILILSGEVHPRSSSRQLWFQRIFDLCQLALSLGFLPHTNVGPLSLAEMELLKTVNISMGLMLEQLTPELLKTVHRYAPSKIPKLRLQQLEMAGKLQIPFTTGLLLGIGETQQDWWETLAAIAQVHERWGHIQEVILQPYCLGSQQAVSIPGFDANQLPEVVAKARQMLPAEITIQIPPNLVPEPNLLLACLEAGARDLGGIGPKDEVNPDYRHREHHDFIALLAAAGWKLMPRLPIYPQYDNWLPSSLQTSVKQWRQAINSSVFPDIAQSSVALQPGK